MKCDNMENTSESLQYFKWNVIIYYFTYVINKKDKDFYNWDACDVCCWNFVCHFLRFVIKMHPKCAFTM